MEDPVSAQQSPTQSRYADPVPASLLAFLWPAKLTGATVQPTNEVRAQLIVGAAFLALRDQGMVQLSVEQGKRLLFKFTHVKIAVISAGPNGTIEGDLAAAARTKPEVKDATFAWMPGYFEDPWLGVVGLGLRSATQFGFYSSSEVDDSGMMGRALHKHHTEYQPIPDRIQGTEALADQLGQRWQRFTREEGGLHEALLDRIRAGISARKVVESGD